MQEPTLFLRIAAGDQLAFRSLYEAYQGRIHGAALKWTRSSLAAEEITQEIFVQLWVSRAKLPEVQDPEAYLFAAVYYKIGSWLKKEKNRLRILSQVRDGLSAVTNDTEERIARFDHQRLLSQGLDKLSPRKKTIYVLSRDLGHSNSEIAQQLNLSPHTVKTHLAQAMKFLRDYLRHLAMIALLLPQIIGH